MEGGERTTTRKTVHSYTDAFREQIARLVIEGGRSQAQVCKEYGLSSSVVSSWVKKYSPTGSFRESDNITSEQKELKELRKENAQLRMENDLLKQAALILGRR